MLLNENYNEIRRPRDFRVGLGLQLFGSKSQGERQLDVVLHLYPILMIVDRDNY